MSPSSSIKSFFNLHSTTSTFQAPPPRASTEATTSPSADPPISHPSDVSLSTEDDFESESLDGFIVDENAFDTDSEPEPMPDTPHDPLPWTDDSAYTSNAIFVACIHHIIIGLIRLAHEQVFFMKTDVKNYLATCDSTGLARFIASYVPSQVQDALSGDTWSWKDLMWGPSTWNTITKGIYFLVGVPVLSSFSDLKETVNYVGSACGRDGLVGRVKKDHMSQHHRLKEISKLLYRYIEGLEDDSKREISACSLAMFTGLTSDLLRSRGFPTDEVFYDIIETTFIILLGTMSLKWNLHEVQAYTALCPPGFVCRDTGIMPVNRMIPTQQYIFSKNRGEPSEERLWERDIIRSEHQATQARYDSGYSHHEIQKMDYEGVGDALEWRKLTQGTTTLTATPDGLLARIWFGFTLFLPVPAKLLQRLGVHITDDIHVNWNISDEESKFSWIQEAITDREITKAKRLSVQLSGTNSTGDTWSFYLRRPYTATDWGQRRSTSNHTGVAKSLSMLEAMLGIRKLPVPWTRVLLSQADQHTGSSDERETSPPEIFDLTGLDSSIKNSFDGLRINDVDLASTLPLPSCTCGNLLWKCELHTQSTVVVASAAVKHHLAHPFKWHIIVGMLLLGGKQMNEEDLCAACVERWPAVYSRLEGKHKTGWEMSLRRTLVAYSSDFEKVGKSNRSFKEKGKLDLWHTVGDESVFRRAADSGGDPRKMDEHFSKKQRTS